MCPFLRSYYFYWSWESNRGHWICPLFRGCQPLGGSVIRCSTLSLFLSHWMINKQHWFMCNNCPLTLTNHTRIVLVIHQHATWKAGNRPKDNYRVSQKIYPNCVPACSLGNGCLSWVLRECIVHVLLYSCIECIPYTHEADRLYEQIYHNFMVDSCYYKIAHMSKTFVIFTIVIITIGNSIKSNL